MLINLYKETRLIRESSKAIGLLKGRGCEIVDDLSFYNQEVASTVDEEFHIKSVLKVLNDKRQYTEFSGRICDSHIEIEKLGVCKYAKPYTTIISLEDSLDYILHRLCGASIQAIRSIPGYTELSRSLLKFNFDALYSFTVESLLGVDEKLDKFISSFVKDTPEHLEDIEMEFLLGFARAIISEASSIVEYVSLYYNSIQPKDMSVIRSKSFCSFVLTTAERLDMDLIIRSEGFDDYVLKVRSFGKKEYLRKIDLKYAE